jgi:hypothetical protein
LRRIRKNEIDSEFSRKRRRNWRTSFEEFKRCLWWVYIGANFPPSFMESRISGGGSHIGGESASSGGAREESRCSAAEHGEC